MAKQDDYIRITARIPPEVHDALVELANRTERSLNGELVERLKIAIDLAKVEPRPLVKKARQEEPDYQVSGNGMMEELLKEIQSMPEEKMNAILLLLK